MERNLARPQRTAQTNQAVIPTTDICLELLKRFGTYPNIISHSRQVARIAVFLAKELQKRGFKLNIALTEAGALLHDIAKAYSIEHPGVNHASQGATWLRELGYNEVAEIVATHVDLPMPFKINERAIVNYADKRVKHDQIVSLKERFEDLFLRYGKSEAQINRIKRLYQRTQKLEEMIFTYLPFSPDFLNNLGGRG